MAMSQPQQASLAFALGQQQPKVPPNVGETSPHAHVATPSRAGAINRSLSGVHSLSPQLSPASGEQPGSPPKMALPGSPPHGAQPVSPQISPKRRPPLPGAPPLPPAGSPIASPHHEAMQQSRQQMRGYAVSVIAPGGGTGINGQVYANLGQDPAFVVDIVGRSRAPYDCYPEYWSNGGPAPNLATFADEVLRQGWGEKSDCFVFGSRGGQVVLPILWERLGDRMPPLVCINGGCAMGLPLPVRWPEAGVSFLLIGGQDYFRGQATVEQYIAETRGRVPKGNCTTAILFVAEMEHMPQAALLGAVLPMMLKAILRWKAHTTRPPREQFRHILEKLNTAGWSGRFMFTNGPGEWAPDIDFGPFHVQQHVNSRLDLEALETPREPDAEPIQMSRKGELKELLRAAVRAAQPSHGVPLANPADKFVAAAQAARDRRKTSPAPATAAAPTVEPPAARQKMSIPPGALAWPHKGGAGLALPIQPAGASTPTGPQQGYPQFSTLPGSAGNFSPVSTPMRQFSPGAAAGLAPPMTPPAASRTPLQGYPVCGASPGNASAFSPGGSPKRQFSSGVGGGYAQPMTPTAGSRTPLGGYPAYGCSPIRAGGFSPGSSPMQQPSAGAVHSKMTAQTPISSALGMGVRFSSPSPSQSSAFSCASPFSMESPSRPRLIN